MSKGSTGFGSDPRPRPPGQPGENSWGSPPKQQTVPVTPAEESKPKKPDQKGWERPEMED